LQISRSGCIVPDMVEDADKNGVCLAVYLLKFDGYQVYLAEYSGREKIQFIIPGYKCTIPDLE
jgi:hypothetical protein